MLGILFTILCMLFFFIVILFAIIRFLIVVYSGFLFFKVINRKMLEYGYHPSLELFFITYGLLTIYILGIYFFCTHTIFGFPAMILLLFFNKALKKWLKDKNKENNIQ